MIDNYEGPDISTAELLELWNLENISANPRYQQVLPAQMDVCPEIPLHPSRHLGVIGIILLATDKYFRFVHDFVRSCDQYFLIDYDKNYFILTDSEEDLPLNSVRCVVEHKPWPKCITQRYADILTFREAYVGANYLFNFDVDQVFVQEIYPAEFLSDGITAVWSSYCINTPKERWPHTRDPKSVNFVSDEEIQRYYSASTTGGPPELYLKMLEQVQKQIDTDIRNSMNCVYEEGALNHYLVFNPPKLSLDPSYCYPDKANLSPEITRKKIITLDKTNNLDLLKTGQPWDGKFNSAVDSMILVKQRADPRSQQLEQLRAKNRERRDANSTVPQ